MHLLLPLFCAYFSLQTLQFWWWGRKNISALGAGYRSYATAKPYEIKERLEIILFRAQNPT